MEQQNIQLEKILDLYMRIGDIQNAKKIFKKILDNDKKRLLELSKVEINENNYHDVMEELSGIENKTFFGDRQNRFSDYHSQLYKTARLLKRV
jgi:hypothetical protein